MKTMVKRASLVALGVAALLAGSAQTARADETIVAKIPFAFVVRGMELPAGDYTITRDDTNRDLIVIAKAQGPRLTFVLTQTGDADGPDPQPKLEFERVGGLMYLSQITLGRGDVRDIPAPASH
jgi:hypothetical protein